MTTMVAPPVMGVMRHVKMSYPTKEQAVAFMVDYVLEPAESKAVCHPEKLKHFGVMPSQKGQVTTRELVEISGWMFDHFPPKGFRGQGERKHHRWGQPNR